MPRSRTQLALFFLPVVLVAVVIVVLCITNLRRPVASKADCDRISIGMTRDQVEDVLGGPPGDYRTRDPITPDVGLYYVFWDKWKGDRGMILVEFDSDNRVIDKNHFDFWLQRQRSWIDRIVSKR
jgi:hypothetical protein